MNDKKVAFPYLIPNSHSTYCIEVWYNSKAEYYYFNSFQEAKEQYLMWCDSKYIRNNYK